MLYNTTTSAPTKGSVIDVTSEKTRVRDDLRGVNRRLYLSEDSLNALRAVRNSISISGVWGSALLSKELALVVETIEETHRILEIQGPVIGIVKKSAKEVIETECVAVKTVVLPRGTEVTFQMNVKRHGAVWAFVSGVVWASPKDVVQMNIDPFGLVNLVSYRRHRTIYDI